MRSLAVGTSARGATAAAVLSALSLAPIVPHLAEDLSLDALARFGVSDRGGAAILGGALAVQLLAALGCLRHRRSGYAGVLGFATVWAVTSAIEHLEAFLPGTFRDGLASRLPVWGIVVLQGAAALAALAALRSSRRTSFSGTGSLS